MPLKSLNVALNEQPKKTSSDIKTVTVGGSIVADFNRAAVAAKKAEVAAEEARASVLEIGLPEYFAVATANPDTPPSSVKLQDDTGSVVLLSLTNSYRDVDPEAAEQVLNEFGAEIEKHAQYVVAAKFDDKIFVNANGKFSKKIYEAYRSAIERVTAQLVRDGVLPVGTATPLTGKEVARVFPSFHHDRWSKFTSEQQAEIHRVIPATVALKPQPAASVPALPAVNGSAVKRSTVARRA